MNASLKVWAGPARAPFLFLAVMLVLIGAAAAYKDGAFASLPFALCLVGAILAHVAVNMFNELSDYNTGIDTITRRTPFSGGSGTLQSGALTPGQVKAAAWGVSALATAIGLYLTARSGWPLLIFIVLGGLTTVFYTTHLAKWVLGELAAGACLGTFVVLGTYFAMTGRLSSELVLLSIPPGILTSLLLLLNEFPDLEADRAGGRKHLVILLGRKKTAVVYAVAMAAVYLVLAAGVALRVFPALVLISLLTLPLAFKAVTTALRDSESFEKMVPALGANVGVVLGTDLLVAVAYFLGK